MEKKPFLGLAWTWAERGMHPGHGAHFCCATAGVPAMQMRPTPHIGPRSHVQAVAVKKHGGQLLLILGLYYSCAPGILADGGDKEAARRDSVGFYGILRDPAQLASLWSDPENSHPETRVAHLLIAAATIFNI